VRDRVDARMTPSDVLEVGDDAAMDELSDLPSAGELVTDGTLRAPEAAVDGAVMDGPAADPAIDGPVADAPDADVPIAR
jgi:hypothetical protein